MISGTVRNDIELVVPLELVDADGQPRSFQFVVDSGFTGYLSLSQSDVNELRLNPQGLQPGKLADGSSVACPMCCGIFAWIAAHAANEAETEGGKRITPYWRTLKTGGELNPKFPGGVEALKVRLEAEGHRVVTKGKKWIVAEFEKRLFTIPGKQ